MPEIQDKIPLLDLKLQYREIKEEVDSAMARVVESQGFILGPEVDAFESECAEYCGSRFGVGVSSGTDALLLSLMALKIGRGDEVITSPYTFFATAGSITRAGATPVFCDIDPVSFNIDVGRIAERLTPRTRAIMPVHLYGQCAEMTKLQTLAGERSVPIVEDAAQAIGAEYHARRAGALGMVGCFSFFPSKNLGAFGDAGLVTTDDPALAERLKMLRVHGGMHRYYHDEVGGNFRIDALQAAILRVKLRRLDAWSKKRRENADIYRTLFGEAGLVSPSLGVSPDAPIALPTELPGCFHIYNQFVIRAHRRDELQKHLDQVGVGNAIYYPLPLHLQKCFADLGYKAGDFPESERAAAESLALPIFPELSKKQLSAVVGRIADFYRKSK